MYSLRNLLLTFAGKCKSGDSSSTLAYTSVTCQTWPFGKFRSTVDWVESTIVPFTSFMLKAKCRAIGPRDRFDCLLDEADCAKGDWNWEVLSQRCTVGR